MFRKLFILFAGCCFCGTSGYGQTVADGFYWRSSETRTKVSDVEGGQIAIGSALVSGQFETTVRATSNWNDEFVVDVSVAAKAGEPPPKLIWVSGNIGYQETFLGTSQRGSTSLDVHGFRLNDRTSVEKIAKASGVVPVLRRHPNHKLAIRFVVQKAVTSGGAMPVKIQLRNVGDKPVKFKAGDNFERKRSALLSFLVTDPFGSAGVEDVRAKTGDGSKVSLTELAPGAIYETEEPLDRWYRFSKAGYFHVYGSYQLQFYADDSDLSPEAAIWEESLGGEFLLNVRAK